MIYNRIWRWLDKSAICLLLLTLGILPVLGGSASAADNQEFNIQVSPSPLAVTLTPGQQHTATLNVRNLSSHNETLKPELTGFHLDKSTNKIELDKQAPANMGQWTHFAQSSLSLAPGAAGQIKIIYDTPKNVGFSYNAAITLSRANDLGAEPGANIKGKVVVFNLVNVSRPDAKRQLKITSLTTSRGSYEFLPAKLKLSVQNLGNVIDQPTGNLFIQRSFDDYQPLSSLNVNSMGGYILPGTTRVFDLEWKEGFPSYVANKDAGGKSHLNWDWRHANQFRFGRYVAKAVIVYNDGQRDVPLIASVNFWVVPWRIVAVSVLVIVVLVMGLFGWGKVVASGTKKVKKYVLRKK